MPTVSRALCAILILSAVLLQACGQRGPLYRPDAPAQTVGETSPSDERKKSRQPPAPQSQKVPEAGEPETPPPVDSDRPATPPVP